MRIIKKNILFSFLFVSEIALAIIHFYYGISSFLDMLFDNFGIKLYFTLFWDYNKSTYKYRDYMVKAIAYHMNPIYCLLISIAIITLSVVITIISDKKSIGKVIICFSVLTMILSLFITFGVMHRYFDEMSHEVV